MTGPIPAELGRLSSLISLSLSRNRLTGSIPEELGSLSSLQGLYLWENRLTGSIPSQLGNLVNLTELWLRYNQLTGPIPTELGRLSNLENLYLSFNQLTGQIPAELGELSNLKLLLLDNNQLTGSIPSELGNLSNLNTLLLSPNQLLGCVPVTLADVPDNDFSQLHLQFCDVLLTALSVGPRPLDPEFAPEHTEYVTVSGVSPITVTVATKDDASSRVLDENGDEIPDADTAQEGHQVEIGDGVTVIRVEAASPDRDTVNTYTVKVTYEDLLERYDLNDNGVIDRDEAIAAVADYFNGAIGRDEALAVIVLYFSSA